MPSSAIIRRIPADSVGMRTIVPIIRVFRACVAVESESERLVPLAGHWSPASAHHTCKGVNAYVNANVQVVLDRRRDPRGAVE